MQEEFAMPRKPRFYLPDYPVHIVQRGHNKKNVFFEDEDYKVYLDWLQEGSEWYEVPIHAYALLPNEIHILASPGDKESASRMMQYQGRRYVPYVNSTYKKTGTIWQGRYKASLIDPDTYLINSMLYIENLPVTAGLAKSATPYKWSSAKSNAQGKKNALITPHAKYQDIGRGDKTRQKRYAEMLKAGLTDEVVTDIQDAWQTGTPLGSAKFKAMVERKLKIKVGHAKRGRPRKNAA
jgi:putative transposase